MIYVPFYGGLPIFGIATTIEQEDEPAALRTDAFFGPTGVISLFGGARSRMFRVSGCLFDLTFDLVVADELIFLPNAPGSYLDGIARPLIDTSGRLWLNVVYQGRYQRTGPPRPATTAGAAGWAIPYRCEFKGLA